MEHKCNIPDSLAPAFSQNSIPVVFAANDRFAPIFGVCLQSLMDQASPEHNYDLVLLHRDVSAQNQATLCGMVASAENISLRFFDVSKLVRDYDLKANAHISVETYYRLLIQTVLPEYDKVLYLDCDMIINEDIANLYATDVEGYLLAAARDPDFLGQLNGATRKVQRYILKKLNMKDPSGYFQAGVLLFNEAEMRKAYTLEQWLTFASTPYRFNDQDVLNLHCEGRVKYLDMAWNLMTDCDHTRVRRVISFAPQDIQQAYHRAHSDPKIIHYAGHRKPWHKKDEDLAEYFWRTAEKTPYYSQICELTAQFTRQQQALEKTLAWRLRKLAKKILGRE